MQLAFLFVIFTIFVNVLVDLPARITIGEFSGSGVLTAVCAVCSCFFLVLGGVFGRTTLKVIAPYAVFILYGAISLFWAPELKDGAQQVILQIGFLGLILLVSRCSRRPGQARVIEWCLLIAPVAATFIYAVSVLVYGSGNDAWLSARLFAIFALFGVGQLTARWAQGSRWALGLAIVVCAVILVSLSRTAFLGALIMFPLSRIRGAPLKGALRAGLYTAVIGLLLFACISFYEPLRLRFFKGDVSVGYGGFVVNGEGRASVWAALISTEPLSHPVGIGAGGSRYFLRVFTRTGLEHPHNDYLRVLIEYGILGLPVWLLSLGFIIRAIWKKWGEAKKGTAANRTACAAFVTLMACVVVMLTDNLMVYGFAQFPLACCIGLALTTRSSRPRTATGYIVVDRRRQFLRARAAAEFPSARIGV